MAGSVPFSLEAFLPWRCRSEYLISDLGPSKFRIHSRIYCREDGQGQEAKRPPNNGGGLQKQGPPINPMGLQDFDVGLELRLQEMGSLAIARTSSRLEFQVSRPQQ